MVQPARSPRVELVDVLRGLAVAGMILVHTSEHLGLRDSAQLFYGKFGAMFAFLFGASFGLLIRRQASHANDWALARWYLARLATLFIVGALSYVFLWRASLLTFAVSAVPLVLVWRWPTKWLVLLAVVCLTISGARPILTEPGPTLDTLASTATSIWEVARFRFDRLLFQFTHTRPFFSVWALGMFILGLLAVRLEVFTSPDRHQRLVAGIGAAGLVSWVAAVSTSHVFKYGLIRSDFVCLTYLAACTIAFQRAEWARRLLRPWAAPGRLAFTWFVLHEIGLEVIFKPWFLGWHVPARIALAAAGVAALALIPLSRWWLERYRFGPVERLWRAATPFAPPHRVS